MGVSGRRPRAIGLGRRRVHYVDDGLVMAEAGATCIALWRTRPDDFLFERQKTILSEVVLSQPERVGFLCVIDPKSSPPEERIRKATVEMLREHRMGLACVSCVVEGQGFRSAISRSVLSGMSLLFGPREFPIKITDTVEHAAIWMANYVTLGPVAAYCETVQSYRDLLTKE